MRYPMDINRTYLTCGFTGRHAGIDLGTGYQAGLNVYAVEDGLVVVSRTQREGYGRHVKILHDGGVSVYAHLSSLMVEVGDLVKKGDVIGLSGGHPDDPFAGNSTGCHLHFEWQKLVAVDPMPMMENDTPKAE